MMNTVKHEQFVVKNTFFGDDGIANITKNFDNVYDAISYAKELDGNISVYCINSDKNTEEEICWLFYGCISEAILEWFISHNIGMSVLY